MKIISLFNNKGGVGKTTLAFHISHSMVSLGYKVLMIDLDPQCNLTICSLNDDEILKIWQMEDNFIENFESSKNKMSSEEFAQFNNTPHSIHYLLRPTEEGTGELECLPPPISLKSGLDLIPGRLTLHTFEDKIAERWNGVYRGEPLSIRTITRIRSIAELYASQYGYDFIIMDTSPSLGILNKVIISTVDGFLVPCLPDMFSLYGIRNIGDYLGKWKKEFNIIYGLISNEKRSNFPENFVRFLGFTIYNAKKYQNPTKLDLAQAHFDYVQKIPLFITKYIPDEVRDHLSEDMINNPIGNTAVMHTHNTLPNVTQKYKKPIWEVPSLDYLETEDSATIRGNRGIYENTKAKYEEFSRALLDRISTLG